MMSIILMFVLAIPKYSWWLKVVKEVNSVYIPQLGDSVVYLIQGDSIFNIAEIGANT